MLPPRPFCIAYELAETDAVALSKIRRNVTMARSVRILWLLLFVAPLASAEIFKCVGKDGLDLYQNFPCQFQSMGWASMNVRVPTAQLAPMPSSQPNTNTFAHADTVAGRSPSSQSRLRLGMTKDDVIARWGEPTDSHWEEPVEGERSEIWSYGNARSVRFIQDLVSAMRQ